MKLWIMLYLYHDKEKNERYLIEEWENSDKSCAYSGYVSEQIENELICRNIAVVELRNASGNDATLIHTFIIFNIGSNYWRMESYGTTKFNTSGSRTKVCVESLYSTRLVEWPTYKHDIKSLIDAPNSTARLTYWNELFSSKENIDNFDPIDVTITSYST